jgi:DNA-directed RNA polymerase subunit alpha
VTLTNMVLPKIEGDAITRKYGRFIISPLESGFGTTLGSALRRVLLSSLPGAAVSSIRVSNVSHEFDAIPGVREDMTQLILQVKQLRVKLFDGVEQTRLRLNMRGSGMVTAADIEKPAQIEIINEDLYLFTVDDPNTQLEIEMTVQSGRGFSPSDDRGRLPIGELPVDAIFSPIRRVNFDVERARVGQRTNYDKLILEVWTDGTIRPEEAISVASQTLLQHLAIIGNIDPNIIEKEMLEPQPEPEPEQDGRYEALYEIPIEQLDLSVRVFNSLKRTGIQNVGEVLEMLERGPDAMLAIRNFGEKSLDELVERLKEKDYLTPELESRHGVTSSSEG